MKIENKVKEKLNERKWYHRMTALFVCLAIVLSFCVPMELVIPGVAATGDDWIDTAITSVDQIPGAPNFGGFINSVKFAYGDSELDTLDAGARSSMYINMHLYYKDMSNSGISTSQRYMYYPLDINANNIVVEHAFEGSSMELLDGKWTGALATKHQNVAGYYSIAENGFIAIKFNEDYINDRIAKGNFEGDLYFEGMIRRADSASGDQEIEINGNKITVQFDDMVKEGSKSSEVTKDGLGNLVVHYSVVINNPDHSTTLSNYKLVDTKFSGNVKNITTSPENIGSMVGGAYEFNTTPETNTIVVEYDYYPTSEEVNSGNLVNTATLQNKTKPSDNASVTKETELPTTFKTSVDKMGTPGYEQVTETLGRIYWQILLSRDYNQSMKGYVIEDGVFNLLTESPDSIDEFKVTDYTSFKTLEQGKDYTISDGKLTLNVDTSWIHIGYYTLVDNDGVALAGQTDANVHNEVKVYPPGSTTPDSSDTEDVYYSENASVSKKANASSKSLSILGYESKPTTNTCTLDWSITITDFHGFVSKTYTDTLQNGTVDGATIPQTLTDDEFNAISIEGLTKGTDYTITRTDTGFTITFNDTDAVKAKGKSISFNYTSTIEAKDLENGKSVEIKNRAEYEGSTSEPGYTVTREDPSKQQVSTFGLNVYKYWVNDDPASRPQTYLIIQRREEGSDVWETYTGHSTWPDGKIDVTSSSPGWVGDLPKSSRATLEHPTPVNYYYRFYETDVPTGYEVSYNKDNNVGTQSHGDSYEVTNTYTLLNVGVNKTWQWDKAANEDSTVRPSQVTFVLYESTDQNTWTESSRATVDVVKSGTNTSYLFTGLPKKNASGETLYYKVEEETVSGYTQSGGTEIISENNGTVNITNTYDKMVISAVKSWEDDEGSEAARPATVKVHLESSTNPTDESSWKKVGSATTYIPGYESITADQNLTSAGGWSFSWTELPRKTADGTAIYYRVHEDDVDNDYRADYDSYANNEGYNQNLEIRNVWKYVNITPKKSWVGDEGKTRPDITVKLQYRRKNTSGTWVDVDWIDSEQETKTISSGQETASAWMKLPKTDDSGNTYYYRAVETNIPEGYIENFDENGLAHTGYSVITNTYNTISITPKKIWSGDENHTGNRNAVTFKLQQSTDKTNWTDVDGKDPITISSGDGNEWTASESWTELPKTEASRQPIYYQIVETSAPDKYTPSASTNRNDTGTVTITNTYNFIEISAVKKWESDSAADRKDVTVHLEQSTNGTDWTTVTNSGETITIDTSQSEQNLKTWSNLPKKTDGGLTIQYKVVEDSVSGYASNVSPAIISGQSGTVTVTNTKLADVSKVALKPEINNIPNNDGIVSEASSELSTITSAQLSDVPVRTVKINNVDTECYIFKWKVTVNNNLVDLVDTLPTDSVYYSDHSVDSSWAEIQGYRLAIKYQNFGLYEQNSVSENKYVTYPYEGDSSKVRFNFDQLKPDYFIYYTATPKSIVDTAVADGTPYKLINSIVHTGTDVGDNAEFTIGKTSVNPSGNTVIEKGYSNQGGKDGKLVESKYTIRINEGAMDLSADDTLNITDIFEVTGYAPGRTDVKDGKTTYVTESMVTGSGLLDAVLDKEHVEVVDLNDLDAEGNPKSVEFSLVPETKTVTEVIKEYSFNDLEAGSSGYNHWRTSCESGESMTITISGNNLNLVKCSDVDIIFCGEWGNHVITKKLSDYVDDEYITPDSEGEFIFTITVPESTSSTQPIKLLSICGMDSFMNATNVTGVQKETTTKNYIYFQVPDEKYLEITYTYSLKVNANTPKNSNNDELNIGDQPPYGSKAIFQNAASVETSDGKATDDSGNNEFVVEKSTGGVTTNSPPSIKKVNIGNQTIDNIEATFKLARWVNNQWEYATSFTPSDVENKGDTIGYSGVYELTGGIIPTTGDALPADLEVKGAHALNLEAGVLYKIVEISNEDGYVDCPYVAGETNVNSEAMKDFVFYFVFSGDTEQYKEVTGGRKITSIASSSSFSVPNAKLIDVSVKKLWAETPDTTVTSNFELFYTTDPPTGNKLPASNKLKRASLIDSTIVGKSLKSNQTGTVGWEDIPNGYQGEAIYYYVIETSYEIGGKTYVRQSDGTYIYQKEGTDPETGPYQGVYTNNGLNKDGTVTCTNMEGLVVRKTWKNADGSVMEDPPIETISFILQGKKTENGAWEDIPLDAEYSTITGNGSVTIPPEYLTDYVQFQVTENTALPYGYRVSTVGNFAGSSGYIDITNRNTQVDKTNLIVKKVWNDGKSSHDQAITVTLYQATTQWADGDKPTAAEVSASKSMGSVQLQAPDWSYTWSNLDNLQSDKVSQYYYYAIEDVPTGYTASYDRSGSVVTQVETITNTPTAKPGELSVQKEWDRVSASNMPESVTMQLYKRARPLSMTKYNIPDNITVSCIGDSITYGEMNNTSYTDGKTYPILLGEQIYPKKTRSEIIDLIKNNGHNNYTIAQMVTSEAKINGSSATAICLMIGTNNILHPESGGETPYVNQLKTYIESLQSENPNTVIFVASIPYFNNKNGTSGTQWYTDSDAKLKTDNANVDTYNSDIKSYVEAANNSKLVFVDINEVVDKETMLADGIHPNATGYQKIADTFYKAIGEYYGVTTLPATASVDKDINAVPDDLTDAEKVGEPFTLTGSDWSHTFSNLDTGYTEDGFEYEYVYYVMEVTESGNWTVSYLHNGQPAQGQMLITVQNTGDEEAPPISLNVVKRWPATLPDGVSLPDSVTVELWRASTLNGTQTKVAGKDLTLIPDASGNWIGKWDNLPADYYYFAKETADGWSAEYTNNGTNTNDATITIQNTLETANLTLNKEWYNGDDGGNKSVEVEIWRVSDKPAGARGGGFWDDEEDEPLTVTEPTNIRFSSANRLYSASRVKMMTMADASTSSEVEETEEPMQQSGLKLAGINTGGMIFAQAVKMTSQRTINNPPTWNNIDVTEEGKTLTSVVLTISGAVPGWTGGYTLNGNWYWMPTSDNDSSTVSVDVTGLHILQLQPYDTASWSITKVEMTYEWEEEPQGPSMTISNKSSLEKHYVESDTTEYTINTSTERMDGYEVRWSYASTDGAEITLNGNKFTVSKPGTAVITATVYDSAAGTATDVTDSFEITIDDFVITTTTASVAENTVVNLSDFATNGSGIITWITDPNDLTSAYTPTALTMSDNGLTLYAVNNGVISSNSLTITVIPQAVAIEEDSVTLRVGNTYTLNYTPTDNVEWDSDDKTVAEVSGGKITAKGAGSTVIRATRGNEGNGDSVNVFVVDELSVTANSTYSLGDTIVPQVSGNIGTVTYTVLNEAGDPDNTVLDANLKAIKNGTAKIRITDTDGTTATTELITVKVTTAEAPLPDGAEQYGDSITISASGWTATKYDLPLTDGQGNHYTYYIREKNGSYTPLSYGGTNEVTLEAGKTTEKTITNLAEEKPSSVELPTSGGTGTRPYYIVGGLLLLLSAAGYTTIKRRRWSTE